MNELGNLITKRAHELGRNDPMTLFVVVVNSAVQGLATLLVLILVPFTTLISGLLSMLTLTLWDLLLEGIWIILSAPLLATSFLHQKTPIAGIIFALPMVLWASVATIFVSLTGKLGNEVGYHKKLSVADAWPNSIHVNTAFIHIEAEYIAGMDQ